VSRRPAEIAFACPGCGREATSAVDGRGACAACGRETPLDVTGLAGDPPRVERCPACAGRQLYVQRDFNQKVGLAVVAAGALLVPFTPFYSSLFAAAIVDAVLYALVPEITVCYRCHAHFRGFARNPEHQPFDLHLAEQYDVRKRDG
jgi:DNA-directed RNA polymerase subunit RPC12/RpoP